MTRIFSTLLASSLAAAILFAPLLVLGQSRFESPTPYTSIERFIEAILRAVVYIALPIISLFLVYAGFLFVTSRGNPEGINKARENFQWVIIGAILILGAWMFATLIAGTVNQIVGR